MGISEKTLPFCLCFYNDVKCKALTAGLANILNVRIVNGGPSNSNNLTTKTLLGVGLLLSWLPLRQDQAACAQPKALGPTNGHTTTKKLLIVGLTFIRLFPKIHIIKMSFFN